MADFRLSDDDLTRDPVNLFDFVEKLGEGFASLTFNEKIEKIWLIFYFILFYFIIILFFCSSYGAVHKAIHKKTGHIVAVKIVPIENDLEATVKEIAVMNEFLSPNIVQFYGSFLKEPDLWVTTPSLWIHHNMSWLELWPFHKIVCHW